jgi:acyl-CoA thioesterase I
MKTCKILLILFGSLLSYNYLQSQITPVKVAFIGNSITAGSGLSDALNYSYPAQLNTMLPDTWVVGNFGVSGRTMLKKGDFPIWKEQKFTDALNFEPTKVVIMLGTNDSKYYNWQYKADFYADYVSMIDTFAQLPSKPEIYICLPLKVFKKLYDIDDSVIHDEIIPIIQQIAIDKNVKLIDFYTPTSDKPYLLSDGIHPDVRGATFVARLFYSELTGTPMNVLFDKNLLAHKPVISSSYTGDAAFQTNPANALDADLFTGWSCKGFPSWMNVDLGETKQMDMFQLLFKSGKAKGIQYKIEVSADNINWDLLVDNTQRTDILSNFNIDSITPTEARYVKLTLTGTSTVTDSIFKIDEFKALEYHGFFHAPLITAEITNTRATKFTLIQATPAIYMSLFSYSSSNNLYNFTNRKTTFTTPFTYSFTGALDKTYSYFTNAYKTGVEVYSDTTHLKFQATVSIFTLEKEKYPKFTVYPNPTSNQLNIATNGPINANISVRICNAKGETIHLAQSMQINNMETLPLWDGTDLSGMKVQPGVYFIQIEGKTIHENLKVMVVNQ